MYRHICVFVENVPGISQTEHSGLDGGGGGGHNISFKGDFIKITLFTSLAIFVRDDLLIFLGEQRMLSHLSPRMLSPSNNPIFINTKYYSAPLIFFIIFASLLLINHQITHLRFIIILSVC